MNTRITNKLKDQCEGICELCTAEEATTAYAVSPKNNDAIENEVAVCKTCLAGSIWNTEPAVQALSYRLQPVHLDSKNTELVSGDTVVLTHELNVKGISFTAAKGTMVRKIRLVPHNIEQIEGKINDQAIVILTKFIRKSS